ncbi:hypothetical protein L596_002808 [Steinernema carpocapsae]|uniref:Nuclear pore complex protein Nup85 n=1 Tax=Steinernema carpocapsae TaxID=34508 RepID=A0A4U8UQN3_STECR|nr:hypothetical protein L596_002808 [Steinernema carpocapsae]
MDSRDVLRLANKKRAARSEAQNKNETDLLSNQYYTKLMNESHSVFSRLKKAAAVCTRSEDPVFMNSLDQASREYRAVLRSAIVDLSKSKRQKDRSLLLCLRGREMLWGLIELVAFSDRDEELAVRLSKWAQLMLLSDAADVYGEIVRNEVNHVGSERNELYWNGVILQVLSCNFSTAMNILNSHSNARSDLSVGKLVLQLERIHRLFKNGYNGDQFRKIQDNIKRMISDNFFSANNQALFVAKLLVGDSEVFREVCSGLVDYWCEVVPLFTITHMPNATVAALHECAEKCFEFGKQKLSHHLDLTIMSAMGGDVVEALLGAANCFGDWWFSAHLSDLIFRITQT